MITESDEVREQIRQRSELMRDPQWLLEQTNKYIAANNEIVRHHRDFQLISDICDQENRGIIPAELAIQQIRNIVG